MKSCSFEFSIHKKKYRAQHIGNNQKCYLSIKLEWFLKDHVMLLTRVMILEIQLCITGKIRLNYILQYIKIENYFKLQ